MILPKAFMKAIIKIEPGFLWVGTDKVSGGKCKVKWEQVCRPKGFGGLGILDLDKFACDLRLCWPWIEWTEPKRAWVGLVHRSDEVNMDSFID